MYYELYYCQNFPPVTSAYFVPEHKTMHMTSYQQQHNNIKKLKFEYLVITKQDGINIKFKGK